MVIYLIGAVLTGWVIFLTWTVFATRSHYFKLVRRTKKEQIDGILDALIEHDELHEKSLIEAKREIENAKKEMRFHIQKIGLVRFSPFDKRGGQESFVLSLLDQNKTGVVLNFMYTPSGLRVYTKKVEAGRGVEFALTGEEETAIK